MSSTLPDTMKLARIGADGALEPATAPVPRPGPREVLIRVAAAGVNYADVLQCRGLYPPPPGAPDWPGLEVAGHVAAMGEAVRDWQVGDAVCALLAGGGHAEYALAEESSCLPVPTSLSMNEAAALPEALFTVWANVFERAQLAAGETFLVHGGAGGIGHIAIQMARLLRHARVFATAGSEENLAFCRELGAELAINHRQEDFAEVIEAHAGRNAVDVVLDHIGGDYVRRHLRLAARNGRIVNIAYLKGARVELDMLPVLLKWLTLTASTLRIRSSEEKRRLRDALLRNAWPLVARGRLRARVHATFPLAQAQEALQAIERPHRGKIVIITE